MAMSKITNSISGRDGRDGREGPVGPRGLKGPKGFSLQMNSNLSFITKVLHELALYIPVSTIGDNSFKGQRERTETGK